MSLLMENNNSNCTVSEWEHNLVFRSKIATLSFSCASNLIAILIMLIGGSYRRLIFRLVLYLLIADFLLVIVQILELLPVVYINHQLDIREGGYWTKSCRVLGFLDLVIAWMGDLVVISIVIYLFARARNPSKFREEQSNSKIIETVTVCFCVLFPFTFSWIPFIDDYFGISGHWCWIELVKDNDCNSRQITEGLLYMLLLYYLPLLIIILLTSLVSLYILYIMCKNELEWEVLLVVLYPIIFDALCLVMAVNRIDSAVRIGHGAKPIFVLSILHSFADSGRTILPSLIVLLLTFCRTSRRMLCPRLRKNTALLQADEKTSLNSAQNNYYSTDTVPATLK